MKKILLLYLLTFVCFGYASEKPIKISKKIYFLGTVIDKQPSGHGILILDRNVQDKCNYHIEGDFSGDMINNATFYISNQTDRYGTITGNFTYKITDNSSIILNLNNVTISNLQGRGGTSSNMTFPHTDLGVIKLVNNNGMEFSENYRLTFNTRIKYTKFPSQLKYLAGTSECYTTGEGEIFIHNKKTFFYFFSFKYIKDKFVFPNHYVYVCNERTKDVFMTPEGDKIFFNRENNGELSIQPMSQIIMADKSVFTISNWALANGDWQTGIRGYYDLQITGKIDFKNESHYEGTIQINHLSASNDPGGWVSIIFNKLKSMNYKDIEFYDGKLTKIAGDVVTYIEGMPKDLYDQKQLQREKEWEAKKLAEKKQREKEDREWEQYKRTHPLKHRQCPVCKGSGRCTYCNGTAWFVHPLNGEESKCPFCFYTGKCSTCHGDGIQDYR